MEILRIILDVFLCVGILIILGYLKELPNYHKELMLQRDNHTHEKSLQQEAYYKQITGTNMKGLFERWVDLFVDMEKMNNFSKKDGLKIATSVYMYGSDKTIKLFSTYMNNLFTNKVKEQIPEYETQYVLYIFAALLSSFKKDFTGYDVDPVYFLKSKINDYDETFSDDALREIKKFIDNN